ncbi:aldo/keto reductase [Actinomadura sp. LOL_016]|uniref:aldo/keto reductase n=1 Tax=unclassified Actinomadura TaxID=2626254 RepID=UPI003A80B16C
MQYRKLGRTGVEVSTQTLGAMMFGEVGNPDHDDCERLIHRALDAGINFVDTADMYSGGESERIVGRALRGRRDDVVLATKCFFPMGDDRNRRGGSRRYIVRAVEDSLRRLGTDRIDLYQVHRHDWDTDLEETLGALTDLVRQGKILYAGSSSFPADWIVEAQWAADRRGSARFVCEQPQYSIFARSVERAVLPAALRHGMGVIPWSPLAGGWLTGKYRRDVRAPAGSRFSGTSHAAFDDRAVDVEPNTPARYEAVERLAKVAEEAGLTLTHLALAFVGEHPAVTSTIIGPKTVEQLDDLVAAADIRLDAAVLDAIDAIVPPGTDIGGIDHKAGDPYLSAEARRR